MIITPLCHRIIVRYARKPIWMPTANSKLFRIAEHTFYSPDETKQILVLQDAYKAQEKSIEQFMKHEFYIPATQSGGLPAEFIKKEIERDKQLYEENDLENARIAKIKEEMLSKQIDEMENRLIEEKLLKEEKLIETAQRVNEYVREQKSDINSFVTRENIEAMIEKAIEKSISFEFFIDMSGRRHGIIQNSNNFKPIKPDNSSETQSQKN